MAGRVVVRGDGQAVIVDDESDASAGDGGDEGAARARQVGEAGDEPASRGAFVPDDTSRARLLLRRARRAGSAVGGTVGRAAGVVGAAERAGELVQQAGDAANLAGADRADKAVAASDAETGEPVERAGDPVTRSGALTSGGTGEGVDTTPDEQFGDIAVVNPASGRRVEAELEDAADSFNAEAETATDARFALGGSLASGGPVGALAGAAQSERAVLGAADAAGLDVPEQGPIETAGQGFIAGVAKGLNPAEAALEAKEVVEFAATQPQRIPGERVSDAAAEVDGINPFSSAVGEFVRSDGPVVNPEFREDVEARVGEQVRAGRRAVRRDPVGSVSEAVGVTVGASALGTAGSAGLRAARRANIDTGGIKDVAIKEIDARARDVAGVRNFRGADRGTMLVGKQSPDVDAGKVREPEVGPETPTDVTMDFDRSAFGGRGAGSLDTPRARDPELDALDTSAGGVAGGASVLDSAVPAAQSPRVDVDAGVRDLEREAQRTSVDVDARPVDVRADADVDTRTRARTRTDVDAMPRTDLDTRTLVDSETRQRSRTRTDVDVRVDERTRPRNRNDDPPLDPPVADDPSGETLDAFDRRQTFNVEVPELDDADLDAGLEGLE
jgi:hypothetical protein